MTKFWPGAGLGTGPYLRLPAVAAGMALTGMLMVTGGSRPAAGGHHRDGVRQPGRRHR